MMNSNKQGLFGNFCASTNPAQSYIFKCPDCSFQKNSTEDLEIHIKTEHIIWFPFKCPIAGCPALRASDNLMREHVHSHHKRSDNRYIYIDNPNAKHTLQQMMDRALFEASLSVCSRSSQKSNILGSGGSPNQTNLSSSNLLQRRKISSDKTKKSRLDDLLPSLVASIASNSNISQQKQISPFADGFQKASGECEDSSSFNSNIYENSSIPLSDFNGTLFSDVKDETMEDLTTAQLMFGSASTLGLDGVMCESNTSKLNQSTIDNLPDESAEAQSMLQSVAALFSTSKNTNSVFAAKNHTNRGVSLLNWDWANSKKRQRRIGLSTAKRRVIGECAKCHRPVTAGARQMHIFFHLGKDHNTYRFRCKHSGCSIEHYRKDQMENHQSKVHGKIDPNMMEDRSTELYSKCQEMSMELLGTTGNTPGPTAAKAQEVYDTIQKNSEMNSFRKRKKTGLIPCVFTANEIRQNTEEKQDIDQNTPEDANVNGGIQNESSDIQGSDIENLECQLCHKYIMSRIKGFHILWHLNNDLGDYKHDRPQSITTHGKREHNDDNSCEDLLYKYENEVKSMSKSCFGVEKIFAKEIKRRTQAIENGNLVDDNRTTEDNNVSNEKSVMEEKEPCQENDIQEQSLQLSKPIYSLSQKKKSRSMRKFGTRRPKSKKQKEEMIRLREISMHLGGGQYFKKRSSESAICEQCGRTVNNRLSDHAYSHLEGCDLFRCQQCNLGHYSREVIVKHLKDFHCSNEAPIDNRLKYAQEIKQSIKCCYPEYFVDAPVPTKKTIEQLKADLKYGDKILTGNLNDVSKGIDSDDGDDELVDLEKTDDFDPADDSLENSGSIEMFGEEKK